MAAKEPMAERNLDGYGAPPTNVSLMPTSAHGDARDAVVLR